MDFDEKDLEDIILKALEGPPKAPATPSLLDYLTRRRAKRWPAFGEGPGEGRSPLPPWVVRPVQPPAVPLPIQFKPKEIKAPKIRRRSRRYPFLEIEI